MSLLGKVAIVTGGSKGIGAATAQRLAKDGAKVVITYSSDSASANALIKTIGSDRAIAVKSDAGKISDIEALIKTTIKTYGRIDILVASAGILPYSSLETTTEQGYDAAFDLNVKGPYFLAQKAAPFLTSGSRIIFISTSLCQASNLSPAYLLYLATKGAIEQMVRVLAKDLTSKNIMVNAVSPGPTDTPLFNAGMTDEVLAYVKGLMPAGRIGLPDEVADVITFLSGNDARWVTGQVLRVNGGFS